MAPPKPCIAPVPGSTGAGHSATYRHPESLAGFPGLSIGGAEVTTLYELFSKSVEAYGERPALGSRPVKDGKAGDFEWLTYAEAAEHVARLAAALSGLGLARQDRVGVYGANCEQWMIAMQACNRMSYECVPLYDSLGENAIEFIMRHSGVAAVFVDAPKMGKLAKAIDDLQKGGDHKLQHVIYWGDSPDAAAVANRIQSSGVSVTSWDAAMAAGTASPVPPVPPSADDYCTIMYTSGTTGDPKGVLIKHSAVVAAVSNVVNYCKLSGLEFGEGDSMLSYLPLAHIFDRVAEEMFLHLGAKIGYWQGDTHKLIDDIGALKPTLFIGVPRIFDRIHGGVTGQIARAGCLKQLLFSWAYNRKLAGLKAGYPQAKASPLFDALVFNKVKSRLGGRVKLIVSGGAPLAPHVEEFLRVAMCAPVAQGYGLTECCAGASIALPDRFDQFATNGPPLPCIEFRFESVPEMNYDAAAPVPAGEVLLRGPCMFDGYYKQPDKTEEVVDAEGWFHTGDIGTLTPSGGLKIVDRKKNIFKLSQGEYIAVEKLEATYSKAAVVEQIWVYGDSYQSKLVAVVVPKKHGLDEWAKSKGKTGSFEELCADPEAAAWVVSELVATGKADKLKGFEMVAAVHLEPTPFNVEDNLLTPTFKLKRPQLKKKYEAIIDKMYQALEAKAAADRA